MFAQQTGAQDITNPVLRSSEEGWSARSLSNWPSCSSDADSYPREEPRSRPVLARYETAEPAKAPLPPKEVGADPANTAADKCPEPEPCPCLPGLGCRSCPWVYGDVEALLLQQVPEFQKRPIVVDANTGATYLSTSEIDSHFDPGLRALFGVRLCNGLAVEFGYFGLYQQGSNSVQKPNSSSFLIFPGNLAGNVFVNMNGVEADYSSTLNNFELNLATCCGCCTQPECGCDACDDEDAKCDDSSCSKPSRARIHCRSIEWFAGVRYLDFGDNLNLVVQRQENGGVETGNYSVQATNHLIGGQIGGRLRNTFNRFGWELTGKAGIFGNDVGQTQTVIDFPNFPLRPTTTAQGSHAAFVGEIDLSGFYRLTDNWSVKAGYNVMWIEGLALAADQLDFNFATSPSGNLLNANGGLFLHGANVGLEARW
jgi:hypothetical protein